MKKRILALVLALMMILGLAACTKEAPAEQPAEQTTAITPLLFEVTDDSGNTVWLFGSIHAGLENFYPLPDYVMDAYNQADALAVEFDLLAFGQDVQAQAQASSCMVYSDGTTIADHISPELYEQSKAALTEMNYYMPEMDYFIPSMWSLTLGNLMIQTTGASFEIGIDQHMLTLAKEEGKPIQEIESPDAQYQMMAKFSPELQEKLLENTMQGWGQTDAIATEMTNLLNAWASGDEAAMVQIQSKEEEGFADEALYKEHHQAMDLDRNLLMTDFAENALRNGEKVFICVGSAHITGTEGMADQLAERGYTVTALGGTPVA